MSGFAWRKPVKFESSEQFTQHRKVEEANAEIARYEKRASVILGVLILLNILVLGVLVYHVLNRD
jgi:hypothetical protein